MLFVMSFLKIKNGLSDNYLIQWKIDIDITLLRMHHYKLNTIYDTTISVQPYTQYTHTHTYASLSSIHYSKQSNTLLLLPPPPPSSSSLHDKRWQFNAEMWQEYLLEFKQANKSDIIMSNACPYLQQVQQQKSCH